jgi:hypothetical protein
LSWKPVVIAEGAKGPIIAKVARIRVYLSRDGLPIGERLWLFFRKNNVGKIKYAISNAPNDTSLAKRVNASAMRWAIEQCFQEGKGEVGMDCYEHRSWTAWHRHLIYVFLALYFYFLFLCLPAAVMLWIAGKACCVLCFILVI